MNSSIAIDAAIGVSVTRINRQIDRIKQRMVAGDNQERDRDPQTERSRYEGSSQKQS